MNKKTTHKIIKTGIWHSLLVITAVFFCINIWASEKSEKAKKKYSGWSEFEPEMLPDEDPGENIESPSDTGETKVHIINDPFAGLPETPDGIHRDSRIILKNDKIGLCFKTDTKNISLISVKDMNTGNPFPMTGTKPLWEINLMHDKKVFKADYSSAGKMDIETGLYALRFVWSDFNIKGEKTDLKVTVSVKLEKNDENSYWDIKVENNSKKYSTASVFFPCYNFKPLGADHKDNLLAIPRGWGRLVPRPFAWNGYGFGASQGLTHPGSMAMQFCALYDKKSENGLFIGTRDSRCLLKWYRFKTDTKKKIIHYSLETRPDDVMSPGKNYQMPFKAVLSVFKGNWYDACIIYRKWALKQPWTSKGPLTERKDVPEWIKKTPICFRITNRLFGTKQNVEGGVENTLKLESAIGKGQYPLIYYNWQHYDPENSAFKVKNPKVEAPGCLAHAGSYFPLLKGVPEAIVKLRKNGIYSMPYVQTWIVDSQCRENKKLKSCALIKKDGSTGYYGRLSKKTWLMCRACNAWHERYVEICKKLISDYKFMGIYMDSLGGSDPVCYAENHNHLPGGPNGAQGSYALARKVRKAVKSINPECILMCENASENFMDVIDVKLMHFDIWPELCPLFTVVYSDYWTWFGRGIRKNDIFNGNLFVKLTNMLLYGAVPGRFFSDAGNCYIDQKAFEKYRNYICEFISYRRTLTDFLSLGRMLRPLKLSGNIPNVEITKWLKKRKITEPGIKHAVWAASSGDVAIIFVNITDKPISFKTAVDLKEYCAASSVDIYKVGPLGREEKSSIPSVNGKLKISLTLNGKSINVYKLKAVH